MQRYRSGHNGADSKSVWSNPRGFESHPLRQKRHAKACLFSARAGFEVYALQGKSHPLRHENTLIVIQ